MPSPPFYNENENRAFPFAPGGTQPPPAVVVDAGFVAGPKSRFVTGTHRVWLAAVRRTGSFFHLDFASDAPELFGTGLTFSREVGGGDFVPEFGDSGTRGLSASSLSGSRSEDAPRECDEPLWSGYVVTGRAAALLALLPADGEVAFAAEVEPALVQNLAESLVVKFAVANDDRTRVQPAAGCAGAAPATGLTFPGGNCVVGDVVFVPGYNANVRQSETDNSITLGAAVGAGAGEPCDEVPVYPGESPPAGSSLLGGGPRCNETVRSLNGVGGPQLTIVAGPGVTVTGSPEDNRVVVNVDMRGLALCFDSVSSRSESC